MEEALRVLERNKPYLPTDEAFIFQVRLQLLTQRAAHIREQHEADCARAAATPVPAFLYLKSLQKQLQDFKDALSPELRNKSLYYPVCEVVHKSLIYPRYPNCVRTIRGVVHRPSISHTQPRCLAVQYLKRTNHRH